MVTLEGVQVQATLEK